MCFVLEIAFCVLRKFEHPPPPGVDQGFRKGGFQNVCAQAREIFFQVLRPLLDTPTKHTIMKFCSAADVCAPKTMDICISSYWISFDGNIKTWCSFCKYLSILSST